VTVLSDRKVVFPFEFAQREACADLRRISSLRPGVEQAVEATYNAATCYAVEATYNTRSILEAMWTTRQEALVEHGTAIGASRCSRL